MELSQNRSGFAAATLGDLAIFAGGYVIRPPNRWINLPTVDIYNARTGRWHLSALSQARDAADAVAVDRQVLFAGGETSGGTSDVVDIYHLGRVRGATR